MAEKVAGELYYDLDGQLLEIKRQLRQKNGYPFNLEMLKIHLQAAIEGRFQNQPYVGRFFMTVTLGSESIEALEEAIKNSGKKISNYARRILKKISVSPEEVEVDLYEVSGAELGYKTLTSRQDIYNRAFGYGFKKSPAEAGPKARIKCNDGKWRTVGMDPVADADDDLHLFHIHSHDGGLWLSTDYGNPGVPWAPDVVWLFVWPFRK